MNLDDALRFEKLLELLNHFEVWPSGDGDSLHSIHWDDFLYYEGNGTWSIL